jgi:membrane associated rhomboid family serine protease
VWYGPPMDAALVQLVALPAPALLIGSVLVVSLWGWLFPPAQKAMILVPYRVARDGQIYRLLTAGWVHGGLTHLGLNMLTLYFFAGQSARVIGPTRFVLLYVTAVVVAFIPTTLRHRRDPGYGTLGASGAVAAVMFSAILLHPKLKLTLLFIPVPVPALVVALLYLAFSAWHSHDTGDGINHNAHFSGALYGSLLTWIFEPARVERTLRTLF